MILAKKLRADVVETALASFLKAELQQEEMTYGRLAQKLGWQGRPESEHSIRNKMARGKFSASFFVSVLTVLGLVHVSLEEIGLSKSSKIDKRKRRSKRAQKRVRSPKPMVREPTTEDNCQNWTTTVGSHRR